jgi:hypothetical protein
MAEAKAKATSDPNLFKPLVLTGEAVERDRTVKDHNDSKKPNEGEWLHRAAAQAEDMAAAEVSFFATLRSRMKDAK